MSSEKKTIAIFDLDGTITTKDTYLEFIKYANGNLKYYLGLLAMSPYILGYYLKLVPNHRLKERFFSFHFKGKAHAHISALGDKFSEFEIPKMTRKAALKVLDWHKNRAHHILILSASADIWLKKWCDKNNFELICTKFKIENQSYTGRLDGPNCFGKEKAKLLKSYFKKNTFDFSYGYGDSAADQFFLDLVDDAYLMVLDDKSVAQLWKP